MNWGIVVFPGGDVEAGAYEAIADALGAEIRFLWYREADLGGVDVVILPGGTTYGNALRPGAAASIAPILTGLARYASEGRPVLGIGNGFQILCEAGLLPGAFRRNDSLRFQSGWSWVRVENDRTPLTAACQRGEMLQLPFAHGSGNYYIDEVGLRRLEASGQVVLRYANAEGEVTFAANPNGSVANIAGLCNEDGNVVGLMPHPERASGKLLGGTDGLRMFQSTRAWFTRKGTRS